MRDCTLTFTHLEKGALRLHLARELDKGGLERVEREVDVEIAFVIVAMGLREPLLDHFASTVAIARPQLEVDDEPRDPPIGVT